MDNRNFALLVELSPQHGYVRIKPLLLTIASLAVSLSAQVSVTISPRQHHSGDISHAGAYGYGVWFQQHGRYLASKRSRWRKRFQRSDLDDRVGDIERSHLSGSIVGTESRVGLPDGDLSGRLDKIRNRHHHHPTAISLRYDLLRFHFRQR